MPDTNLIVFRDSARQVSRQYIEIDLRDAVAAIRRGEPDSVLEALVLAGQLEAALSDFGSAYADESSCFTDELARCFVGAADATGDLESSASKLSGKLPESVRLSDPEGFAHYALHPGDVAEAATEFAGPASVALVGIRSIGTTLSAVACARLEKERTPASRITVRPTGHPYDRQTQFNATQKEWIQRHISRGSTFLVLDEGPGLSGSSFLSVAESLVDQGVAADRITLIGTRECDPEQLCAREAGPRWRRFRWKKVGSRIYKRFSDLIPLSGGAWRGEFLPPHTDSPACWTDMESLKFLSRDRKHIFKFEGIGRGGNDTYARANAVYEAGLGPRVERSGDGMNAYEFISGQPLSASDLSAEMIEQIARCCAFRASEFKTSATDDLQLQEMVEFNFAQETGHSLELPQGCLSGGAAVFVDARMQPWEWIRSRSNSIVKVDAAQHGDDHFLPGPTDIAWDLAGAIVEWDMSAESASYLLERFRAHATGKRVDNAPFFVLAYTLFRLARCRMALGATADQSEKARLQAACDFYHRKLHAGTCALHSVDGRGATIASTITTAD